MAFTQFKKLSAQAFNTANNTWGAGGTTGVDLNTGLISLVDYALGGISTFTNPSGATSLSFTAGGGGDVQNGLWRWTGTISADTTITTAAGDATTYLNGFYGWSNTTSGSFTLTLTTANGSVVLPQGRRGVLYVNNVNSIAPFIVAMVGSSTADPVPAGTSMLFKQASAPSGYTQVTSLNDYALRLVSGTGAGTGGSVGFTTAFASQTPAGSVSTTTADVPAAGYTSTTGAAPATGSLAVSASGAGTPFAGYAWVTTARTLTTGVPTFTGTAINLAVQYVNLINATRD